MKKILVNLFGVALLVGLAATAFGANQTVSVGGNIQSALDSVAASGGGTVTLAAGTHSISSSVAIDSNVTLQGAGSDASTLKSTGNFNMIVAAGEGLVNVTIQNLIIRGNNALNGGGIQLTTQVTDMNNVNVLNVQCYNTGWGVHIKGAKNVTIEDCTFEYNGTVGKEGYAHNLYLRRCYGAVVRNCKLNNSTTGNGCNVSYSEDVEFYDCEMIGNYFRGVRAAVTVGYLVHDCIIGDNGNVGLFANAEGGIVTTEIDWRRNVVYNNSLEGVRALNGATGVAYDNTSYGNGGANFSLPSAVLTSGNTEVAGFTPDPNKTYYIDSPVHNLRLAATGSSEDAYATSTSTTGADVEWKFVAKGNGYWHLERAAGGSKPRLRTDVTASADMQETSSSGTYTYYGFTPGSSAGTYFLTLPDGPSSFSRLQIDQDGLVKMVTASYSGTWESFKITEASGGIVLFRKRNATGYGLDGGNGGANGQNVYLWSYSANNVNQQWEETDRGDGFYSYTKKGTDYSLDGGNGGANGQNVYLWTTSNNNYNQHWKKVDVGGGYIQLQKRNSTGYAIDGGNGGANGQNLYLWGYSSSNQNQHWQVEYK